MNLLQRLPNRLDFTKVRLKPVVLLVNQFLILIFLLRYNRWGELGETLPPDIVEFLSSPKRCGACSNRVGSTI